MRLLALALTAALLAGCARSGPAPAGSLSEPEPPRGPNVRADWSRLEGEKTALRPDTDGGRWYEGYTGELIPSEDYGDLVPYVGSMMYSVETWLDDSGQEQSWYADWPTFLYGLMTREGRLVTDPVYLSADQAEFTWQGRTALLPVLLLSQVKEEWKDLCDGRRYAVAAQDGSWITGFEFWGYATRTDELLLYGPGGVTWMDAVSGAREDWSWEALGVTQEELPSVVDQVKWLYGFQWTDAGVFLGDRNTSETAEDWGSAQVRVFRPETAGVVWMSRREWEEEGLDQWLEQQWPSADSWESERDGDQITLFKGEESYTLTVPGLEEGYGFEVCEPYACFDDYSGEQPVFWLFRLSDGELLTQCGYVCFVTDPAHPDKEPYILARNKDRSSTLYAPDLEPLYTFPACSDDAWLYCALQDGLLTARDDQSFFGCYDLDAGAWIFYRNLSLGD